MMARMFKVRSYNVLDYRGCSSYSVNVSQCTARLVTLKLLKPEKSVFIVKKYRIICLKTKKDAENN